MDNSSNNDIQNTENIPKITHIIFEDVTSSVDNGDGTITDIIASDSNTYEQDVTIGKSSYEQYKADHPANYLSTLSENVILFGLIFVLFLLSGIIVYAKIKSKDIVSNLPTKPKNKSKTKNIKPFANSEPLYNTKIIDYDYTYDSSTKEDYQPNDK